MSPSNTKFAGDDTLAKARSKVFKRSQTLHATQNLIERAEALIEHISAKYNMTPKDVISKSRKSHYFNARSLLVYALKSEGYSYKVIALLLGKSIGSVRYSVEYIDKFVAVSRLIEKSTVGVIHEEKKLLKTVKELDKLNAKISRKNIKTSLDYLNDRIE